MSKCKCMSDKQGNNCVCGQLPYVPGVCILGNEPKMNDSESKALWKIVSELKGQGKAHQYFLEGYQERFKKLEERLSELEQWTRKDEDRVYARIKILEDSTERQNDRNVRDNERIKKLEHGEKQCEGSFEDVYHQIDDLKQEVEKDIEIKFEAVVLQLARQKELNHKWQRDVEEKCIRTIDKNKELQVEVDALKQMIWKLREKIHDIDKYRPNV